MSIPPDRSPDRITPGKSLEPIQPPVTPGQTPSGFESHMQGTGPPRAVPGTPTGPTPMDVTKTPPLANAPPSIDSISMQARNVQDELGTIGGQLRNQNLKLKRSQSHLVRQKLGDATSHIRAAGAKLGVNTPEEKLPGGLSGIARFIAMVNDGQNQLVGVQNQLNKLSAQGARLNPAEMLSVQVKMGLAQQEIEYTSTLLSRVIQSITTVINTQL